MELQPLTIIASGLLRVKRCCSCQLRRFFELDSCTVPRRDGDLAAAAWRRPDIRGVSRSSSIRPRGSTRRDFAYRKLTRNFGDWERDSVHSGYTTHCRQAAVVPSRQLRYELISWPTFVTYLSPQCLEWAHVPYTIVCRRITLHSIPFHFTCKRQIASSTNRNTEQICIVNSSMNIRCQQDSKAWQ